MPSKQLYHFTHSSPEIKTLADLLNDADSPVFLYNEDPYGFLKLVGEDGLTNRQRIEATYTLPEDAVFIGADFTRMPILVGTLLYLEFDRVNAPSFLTAGINVVSNDEPAFKAAQLARLEADSGYVQIDKPIQGKLTKGSLKSSYPDVSVWIWCAALSPKSDENNELSGQFFNLSPFIEKIVTNSSKNGGNFQIKLPPLACELDKDKNIWVLKKASIGQYVTNNKLSLQRDGYVAQTTMFQPAPEGDDVLIRTPMLFHNIIGSNDLVFIRFETLSMERDQRYSDAQEYYISKRHLANRIYDMIGLVDSNTQSVNPANNDVSVTITGRDLSKLFIEDGTYFYALENSQGILKFAGQSTIKSSLINRIFADSGMSFIGLYMFNSIEYILKFIIQQLSNIKIVPNDLFISYAKSIKSVPGFKIEEYDSRNRTYKDFDLHGGQDKKKAALKEKAIAYIEGLRSRAKIKNSVSVKEDEIQLDIFDNLIKFLHILRINNNRLTNGSSQIQGWKGFLYKFEKLTDNQVPTYFAENLLDTKGEMPQNFYSLINTADNYIDAGLISKKFKKELASGIWQIIDLVIDKSVASRRLVDSSFSTASGSLLNFLRSACQEPLVEFYMDTYGDKFNLIVRRPPYDQKALISLIEGRVNTEDGQAKVPPAIVDVYPEDVITETLMYDDSQIYSWYHFFPRTALIGNTEDYSLSYLGALYFPEYADIYGSKPFQQSNSYIPYHHLNTNDEGMGIDEQQAVEDLKYVIESSQYLPFTRKGTLTLNRDRRLKIGNVLRYKSTGEIFFITAVQHSFSISDTNVEAITTVNVERGMIEQLIYGTYLLNDQGKPKFVSYFNIINTKLVFNRHEAIEQETRKVKKESATPHVISKDVVTPLGFIVNNFIQGSQIIDYGKNVGLGNLETYNQYPKSKNLFTNFINMINQAGYWVTIGGKSANRTYAQQAALKRENTNNADPGHSKHERGSAIDITLVDKRTGRVHSKSTDKDAWKATGVPAIAESLGLQWAGGDGSFGKYIDRVHFEIKQKTELLSHAQQVADQYEYKTENVKKMVIDKTGIFQNFKVNQFSFNFFRKRLQNNPEFRNVTSRKIYDNGGQLLDDVIVRSKKKRK